MVDNYSQSNTDGYWSLSFNKIFLLPQICDRRLSLRAWFNLKSATLRTELSSPVPDRRQKPSSRRNLILLELFPITLIKCFNLWQYLITFFSNAPYLWVKFTSKQSASYCCRKVTILQNIVNLSSAYRCKYSKSYLDYVCFSVFLFVCENDNAELVFCEETFEG